MPAIDQAVKTDIYNKEFHTRHGWEGASGSERCSACPDSKAEGCWVVQVMSSWWYHLARYRQRGRMQAHEA